MAGLCSPRSATVPCPSSDEARGDPPKELAALPLPDTAEAATQAIDCGLVVAEREGRLAYRHALLGEAVYAELAEPHRTWLHEAFANVVRRRGDRGTSRRAAEVARHLRLAGRDDLAVDHLRRAAADARAVAALAEAASFLDEAIRLRPRDAELSLELAEVEAWRGGAIRPRPPSSMPSNRSTAATPALSATRGCAAEGGLAA